MLEAAVASLVFILLLASVFYWLSVVQRRNLNTLELKPNCLLTRYPLVFLTGRRSIFYFLNYWNQIPDFLKEHGYQVQVLHLPWRNSDLRKQNLQRYLQSLTWPVHILGDHSISEELNWLSQNDSQNRKNMISPIISLTEVQVEKPRDLQVDDLKPAAGAPFRLNLKTTSTRNLNLSISDLLGPIFWTRCLLRAHNTLNFTTRSKASPAIEPVTIGLNKNLWEVETQFLSHAIFLAERDLQ